MTTRTETERIRCPSCAQLVPCPVGPLDWQPAYGKWIRPVTPLTCQNCGTAIGAVQLSWLVTIPMRLRQLASWGLVLCTRQGEPPTHEDLDQVEKFFAFVRATS